MNYTNENFKENDCWGTPKSVWQSIQHLIPTGITLFDPFYYDGKCKEHLKEVFPENEIIHEEEIDFFHHSVAYDMILTNPPFGTSSRDNLSSRDDFIYETSNKQLGFLQHIYKLQQKV